MSKTGTIVLRHGHRSVLKNGTLALFNANEHCRECCECKPYTLATFTTTGGTWDLTPYQGDSKAKPHRYWRLVNNYMSYVPQRQDCVDKNGKLVGLPNSISTTTYKYTWYFRIEIGCKDKTGRYINWPGGAQSNIFPC